MEVDQFPSALSSALSLVKMDDEAEQEQDDFTRAADWLSSNPEAAKLPNEVKLEIYGLYKYALTGAGPADARPSFFYPAQRAKWDAWAAQAKAHPTPAGARERYVQLAKEIGWAGEKARGPGWRSVSIMAPGQQEQAGEGEEALSPIHEATLDDDLPQVRELLKRRPECVNERGQYGYTPLHLAADRGHVALAKLLLENGADRQAKDEDDQTPLQLAIISGQDDIVKMLDIS